jgi:hypothetical protein
MSSVVRTASNVAKSSLKLATWNIAAINNNPFEYWITHDDPAYAALMQFVQNTMDSPGEMNVPISDLMTASMIEELAARLNEAKFADVEDAVSLWNAEYQGRSIIEGFMKDKLIGTKRLMSMPDRTTNTLNTGADGKPVVCRPSVINCSEADMSSLSVWWPAWLSYMFDPDTDGKRICQRLQPIKRSKYPAITEQEEKVSLPLQTLALAAFDAILVYVMNNASISTSGATWQSIKATLCTSLVKEKDTRSLAILESKLYLDCDLIFIQEANMLVADRIEAHATLAQEYYCLRPLNPDMSRNQNSFILASKTTFATDGVLTADGLARDVTQLVMQHFPADSKIPVATGDLFVCLATDRANRTHILASFHGDTNGLATIPVVHAVHAYAQDRKRSGFRDILVMGLDANTAEQGKPGKKTGCLEFSQACVEMGLTSCWGDTMAPDNYTTFTARTSVQPQLNKAVAMEQISTKGDRKPCDYILFYKAQASASNTFKDNTGQGEFVSTVFPTLTFPSDHAIVATTMQYS